MKMTYTRLNPHHTLGARIEEISRESGHYLLSIPAGPADAYRLAQLDDYAKLPRRRFPHHSLILRHAQHIALSLLACTSSESIAGTWGFGLWNDPFGLSLGFGGNPFRLPVLPNAVWFFGASEENYLSFRNAGRGDPAPTANGFLAQIFRAPRFHPLLILAGLALPFSRRMTRRLLGRVIKEDGAQLWNNENRSRNNASKLAESRVVDPTQWHRYRFEWSAKRVLFEVDDVLVFESPVSPNPPLGLVIWIDNQYAAFTPDGKIGMGVLQNEAAWLEVKEITISPE